MITGIQIEATFILYFRDGVDEGIDWIVECVKRNSFLRPPTQKEIT